MSGIPGMTQPLGKRGPPKGHPQYGGRKKGQKNRATVDRDELVAQGFRDVHERARATGRKLGMAALSEGLQITLGMAAKYQPGTDAAPNPNADEKSFRYWLEFAMRVASQVAPYESPRLQTTTLRTDADQQNNAQIEVRYIEYRLPEAKPTSLAAPLKVVSPPLAVKVAMPRGA